jgi:hypothetical protein
MRLKWLLDGVEDYEYIQILKNFGRVDLALQIARSVGADWTHWTRCGSDRICPSAAWASDQQNHGFGPAEDDERRIRSRRSC